MMHIPSPLVRGESTFSFASSLEGRKRAGEVGGAALEKRRSTTLPWSKASANEVKEWLPASSLPEYSSGTSVHQKVRISKAGNKHLRRDL